MQTFSPPKKDPRQDSILVKPAERGDMNTQRFKPNRLTWFITKPSNSTVILFEPLAQRLIVFIRDKSCSVTIAGSRNTQRIWRASNQIHAHL